MSDKGPQRMKQLTDALLDIGKVRATSPLLIPSAATPVPLGRYDEYGSYLGAVVGSWATWPAMDFSVMLRSISNAMTWASWFAESAPIGNP